MDKAKEYIKMCEGSELIPNNGEVPFFYANEIVATELENDIWLDHNGNYWFTDPKTSNELLFWLPRQDQLQNMLIKEDVIDLAWQFGRDVFCTHEHKKDDIVFYYDKFTSFEQLWLAFVMKELYKKEWDEKKWTNQ